MRSLLPFRWLEVAVRASTWFEEPAFDVPDMELPSVVPEWERHWEWDEPGCDGRCLCGGAPEAVGPLSPEVARLAAAVEALGSVDPRTRPGEQALLDAEALLAAEQRLRVLELDRIGDVAARGLHELTGARTPKTWLRQRRPDGDSRDAALAGDLRRLPVLGAAVASGAVSITAAKSVTRALERCTRYVDRPDGLIDGQPGDAVVDAVIGHVVALVCRDLQGLADDDPRLVGLLARARRLLAADGTQAERLERAFTWLAEEVRGAPLRPLLDELVMVLLPTELEERADGGKARRGLRITPLPDGQGFHLCGDLDQECGERAWTLLRAEMARDPENAADTAGRAEGTARTPRQRMHDAFDRVLERYLGSGLAGTMGKQPVQVSVVVSDPAQPYALPARGQSGQLLPRSLVRRWWCDAKVTAYVVSMGGKALRAVHAQRTVTGVERRALDLEGDGRCAGDGCCSRSPYTVLRPHHVLGYAENAVTCLDETLLVCDALHHDLHTGKRAVRLRDGRWLDERGFRQGPEPPPF